MRPRFPGDSSWLFVYFVTGRYLEAPKNYRLLYFGDELAECPHAKGKYKNLFYFAPDGQQTHDMQGETCIDVAERKTH